MSEPAPPAPAVSTATATDAPPPARASVRWGSYTIVMLGLLGLGYVLSKSWLWPTSIMPGWMWLFVSAGHGQACYATAILLGNGMVGDAADMLLTRGWRVLARLVTLLGVIALAVLAVWAWRHQHWLVAVAAAVVATLGSLTHRLWPGLPRARARIRPRRPPAA